MTNLKTIKGIREEKWAEFKSLAARKRISMGRLLENMIAAYSKYTEDAWRRILYMDKALSDKEAEELSKMVKELRKEKWFDV